MYSGDHNESLPPNHEDYCDGQAASRSDAPSWVTGNAFTDTTSSNIQRGLLFRYLSADATYRCPSDRSTVRDAGKLPRTRHYGMSTYMNGTGNSATDSGIAVAKLIFRKQSNIQDPGPAKAFVFIDNHPGNTAGGSFSVSQPGSSDAGDGVISPVLAIRTAPIFPSPTATSSIGAGRKQNRSIGRRTKSGAVERCHQATAT